MFISNSVRDVKQRHVRLNRNHDEFRTCQRSARDTTVFPGSKKPNVITEFGKN